MTAPVHVLVEGPSDAAALRVLAVARGVADTLEVVDMGGATNAARQARRLRASYDDPVLLGLCDAREQRFLERVDPGLAGVFVCEEDLEDELIRALGPETVLDVLAGLGDLARFRTFQAQPEWRGRPEHDQLRRFAGTRSGRKTALAAALAARLEPATTPEVLVRLLREVGRSG